jgi:hypothetical protein
VPAVSIMALFLHACSGQWRVFHRPQASEFLAKPSDLLPALRIGFGRPSEKHSESVTPRTFTDEGGPALGASSRWVAVEQSMIADVSVARSLLLLEQQGSVAKFAGKEKEQWKVAN